MSDKKEMSEREQKLAALRAKADAVKARVNDRIQEKLEDFEIECAEYELMVQESFEKAISEEGIAPHKLVIIRGVPGVPPMLFRSPDNGVYSWFLRDGVLDAKKSLTPEQIDTLLIKCARVPDNKSLMALLNDRNPVVKLEIANMMLGYMRKMRTEEGKEPTSL